MSKKNSASPDWETARKLTFLIVGFHKGYPFKQGFPTDAHGEYDTRGTYTVVTAWGEKLEGVVLRPHSNSAFAPLWDISKAKRHKYAAGLARKDTLLGENLIAGWQQES